MITRRAAMHFPVGLAIAAMSYFDGSLTLAGMFGFIAYELTQDNYIKDRAYRDIIGALAGLIVGGCVLSLIKLGGSYV